MTVARGASVLSSTTNKRGNHGQIHSHSCGLRGFALLGGRGRCGHCAKYRGEDRGVSGCALAAVRCGFVRLSLRIDPKATGGLDLCRHHYFTSADYPNDRGAPYETGLKELSKARFSQAVHALNQNHEDVVTVYFYNRADHTRQVAISVDYTSG